MTATEESPRRGFASAITGDVRTRIMASFVILLALALAGSVLVVRQVLLVRHEHQVRDQLRQEVSEFRRLAGGIDPETARPFGTDVNRIFQVFLSRNVPGEDEQLTAIPRRGTPRYRAAQGAEVEIPERYIRQWRRLRESEQGEIQTPSGDATYQAVPVRLERRTLGAFVVSNFLAGERGEINDAVRILALVAGGALLIGAAMAFLTAGRVLAPLRQFRDAATAVSGTDMTRRLYVEGSDDISELGRAFNRMLDRLEAAFSTQKEFIRDVSHELRTPIAVIRGHLELLAEGHPASAADRQEAVGLVVGELDRMSRFVDDLLLLARSEQPDFLQPETIQLDGLGEELLAKARGLAKRDWKLGTATRRSIVADRQRITQAVMNLVQNATQHTTEADEVEIGSRVNGEQASIWVRDSGEGIPAEEQRKVFERFKQGRGSKRRAEGAGLGLAIVRAIAEAHGGRVELRSQPGEGAVFTLIVPVEGPGESERKQAEEVGR